ncbi:MAG: diacylglycerol kinase [bacterium]|nr:diacylglycerol kinase [bacterium]
MRKKIKSIVYALRGLRAAYSCDISFRLELASSAIFLVFGYIVWPLSMPEFLFFVMSYILIITAELFNTALEQALDRLHPGRHEAIGASKDIAAAAVFVTMLFAGFVFVVIGGRHLGIWFV